MIDFELTDDQKMILEVVEDFCKKEIVPRAKEMEEKKEIPKEIIKGMADLGLLGMCVSQEYGGMGLDAVLAGLVGEKLARADTTCSIAVFFLVQCSWGYNLDRYGTKEAKEEVLPKVCRGERFLGIATTEPGCGSDLNSMRTQIKRVGNEFLLNGEKLFISGVKEVQKYGGGYITLAKQTPELGTRGMTLFYLPVADPGVVLPGITPRLEKEIGRESISCGGFGLENIKIPAKYILGEENKGFYIVHPGYEFARGIISLVCVGAAEKTLENAIEYIKQRKVFGEPLARRESIQFKIADHFNKLDAARLLGLKALWMFDKEQKEGKFKRLEVSKAIAMAKMNAPVWALAAADDAMQWQGAFGYTTESDAQQAWRAIRSFMWAEGAHEIMMAIVAREILGKEYLAYK